MFRKPVDSFEKGKKLVAEEKHEEALRYFEDALKLNPRFKEAYNEKGKALLTIGQANEAVRCFTLATMVDPDYTAAWENMEAAQLIRDRYDLAIKCINQIIRINSKDADALLRKGRLLVKLDKPIEAGKCFISAIGLDPTCKDALNEEETNVLVQAARKVMPEVMKIAKKICLLGDPAAGKTSLIRRYVYDKFADKYLSTMGAKISKKVMEIPGQIGKPDIELTLIIWDIAGQKDFRRVQKIYYQGAKGALVVSDITRRETLDNINNWIKQLYNITDNVPIVCLANKSDLIARAEFNESDLRTIAGLYGVDHMLTSAKTGKNVEKAFLKLGEALIEA